MNLFGKAKGNNAHEEIDAWVGRLSALKEKESILEAVETFDIGKLWNEQPMFNYTIEKCKALDSQVLPLLIDALYRSDDNSKFILGCALLDITCENLPYVTNLESIDISVGKFRMFFNALISVWERCWNGIGDCMMLILLNFAKHKELFNEAQYDRVVNAATQETATILKWIEESKPAAEEIPGSLELLLDVAGYFNNETLLDLTERALILGNKMARVFAVITLLKNDRAAPQECFEPLAEDMATAYKFLRLLERADRVDLFPEKYANQEHIAKSHLCDWLAYPTELGAMPDEIECIQTMHYNFGDDETPDIHVFYVYKFRSSSEKFREKGWMVGLCGGYEKGASLTTQNTGHVFSMFEILEGDGIQQGANIFNLISGYWKQRAAEAEELLS